MLVFGQAARPGVQERLLSASARMTHTAKIQKVFLNVIEGAIVGFYCY